MQSTIPLVSTFSQFDSIQSDLISVFPVTRPLRFVHRELGLGHYGEILTRTFRILHLQRLHAKAIYPTSTIYILLGFYFTYWSYKFFDPYFLDQPVFLFVNGGKFSKQYVL